MDALITQICVAVFPVAGGVAVWAAVRGILHRRVAWNRSRELSGREAVVASVFVLLVGVIVLFLGSCYWFL